MMNQNYYLVTAITFPAVVVFEWRSIREKILYNSKFYLNKMYLFSRDTVKIFLCLFQLKLMFRILNILKLLCIYSVYRIHVEFVYVQQRYPLYNFFYFTDMYLKHT